MATQASSTLFIRKTNSRVLTGKIRIDGRPWGFVAKA
jgi:hypothetical protein